ncbi:MAG: DEAD/DEAH box helicase [Anaerolineae bacterium]|nr:DEAD/DEAH box helicase [Anaerolineae bacterium]
MQRHTLRRSMNFETLNLRPELMKAVVELGYETPTPIQERAIPALIAGRDVLGQAQTGTGKTAAFALPLLEKLDFSEHGVQGLILAPTRELANQVAEAIFQYGRHLGAKVLAIYGGSSYVRQIKRLESGVHVVVGTPGRVIDLIDKGALDLSGVRYLVLDEADEMLKMGFIDDVETILSRTPDERQTALFSATLPTEIRRLATKYMHDPETVAIEHKTLTVPQIEQRHYLVDESSKLAAVARLLEVEAITSALIFVRTKIGAAQLADELLSRGFPVEALHGDMAQDARETVMRRFRRGHVSVLVATDVAARGLDIEDMSHVINYDVPYDAEDYVHRVGRTGRAGRAGVAITLVTPRERRWLKTIESFTGQRINPAKLPTAADVYARRDAHFSAELETMLAETDLGRELSVVSHLLEAGYDAAEVAAAAIRLARASEAQRPVEDIREPKPRTDREREHSSEWSRKKPFGKRQPGKQEDGMVRLMLNAGRTHGIQPGDVVGAIAGEAGIPGRAIGAIDIHADETFVDVKDVHVDRVIKRMHQRTMRGRKVTLKRA